MVERKKADQDLPFECILLFSHHYLGDNVKDLLVATLKSPTPLSSAVARGIVIISIRESLNPRTIKTYILTLLIVSYLFLFYAYFAITSNAYL